MKLTKLILILVSLAIFASPAAFARGGAHAASAPSSTSTGGFHFAKAHSAKPKKHTKAKAPKLPKVKKQPGTLF